MKNLFLLSTLSLMFTACSNSNPAPSTESTRITEVTLTPASPATLKNGDKVTVKIKFITNQPDGVSIYALPLTGTELALNKELGPEPGFVTGDLRETTRSFTILSGTTTVNQIRLVIYLAKSSELLYKDFRPVQYSFKP